MSKTIEQIAKELQVTEPVAYGFLNFLRIKGLVTAKDGPGTGKRGRKPMLWQVSDEASTLIADALSALTVATQAPAETLAVTVTTETVTTENQTAA